jgi:DNA-3-methyladenine glycosylase
LTRLLCHTVYDVAQGVKGPPRGATRGEALDVAAKQTQADQRNRLLGAGNVVLPTEFYCRDTARVAHDLLGKLLVRCSREGVTSGRIVEVEAYLPEGDPASHAARGCTRSNRAMFGPPGRAYVYPIHSRHCLNAVTRERGVACAVLIRAVEPVDGIALMQRRRNRESLLEVARGPARLCEAFAVDRRLDHWDLTRGKRLWICEASGAGLCDDEIGQSVRIGVTSAHHLPLRYFVQGNPYVSGSRHDPTA